MARKQFMPRLSHFILLVGFFLSAICATAQYAWHAEYQPNECITQRIKPPDGYERLASEPGSFAEWLRGLPLKPEGTPVRLYNGELKTNQTAHFAVIDIDVGNRDLQQCADAIIRLRAEYLFSIGDFPAISFCFTSGDTASFVRWIAGYRPKVSGNKVTWKRMAPVDSSYSSLRKYLEDVMMYAGSYSLSKELQPVKDVNQLQIGDVYIHGGFPGHAVLVVDKAVDLKSGNFVFLLAQSYMPAQEIHVLRSFDNNLTPWYPSDFGDTLETPEWTFSRYELARFPNSRNNK